MCLKIYIKFYYHKMSIMVNRLRGGKKKKSIKKNSLYLIVDQIVKNMLKC